MATQENIKTVKSLQKSYFDVLGLCCSSEVPLIENILNPLEGVKEVAVIVATRTVIVVHDNLLISQIQIGNKSLSFSSLIPTFCSIYEIPFFLYIYVETPLYFSINNLLTSQIQINNKSQAFPLNTNFLFNTWHTHFFFFLINFLYIQYGLKSRHQLILL